MTLMEKGLTPDQIRDSLCDELAKRYEQISVNGKRTFRYSADRYFTPLIFPPPWDAIVIEYNGFDEGDFFYFDQYDDIETLLADVLAEVEQ